MREINMLKFWRRFVGGRERWGAKILRRGIRV